MCKKIFFLNLKGKKINWQNAKKKLFVYQKGKNKKVQQKSEACGCNSLQLEFHIVIRLQACTSVEEEKNFNFRLQKGNPGQKIKFLTPHTWKHIYKVMYEWCMSDVTVSFSVVHVQKVIYWCGIYSVVKEIFTWFWLNITLTTYTFWNWWYRLTQFLEFNGLFLVELAFLIQNFGTGFPLISTSLLHHFNPSKLKHIRGFNLTPFCTHKSRQTNN